VQPQPETTVRVSTLELFFDLVFVFTITQLTQALVNDPTWFGAARVVLLLGIIWWMYDGYAWMTNAAAPTDPIRRGLMLAGMGGFLLIALGIPTAFDGGGWAFGVGYFIVNAIHSTLIFRANPAGMRVLGPLNAITATLVLVGGFFPHQWRLVFWCAALVMIAISPYLHPIASWTLSAAHFVERHGLIVIIALGESIVAVGVGAAGQDLGWKLLTVAMLGLVLSFLLWWIYFGGDDVAAEHALNATPVERRGRLALHAFGYAHYPLLFGVVAFAAGVKKAATYAGGHVYLSQALVLGAGVGIFLLADALFRGLLGIGQRRWRVLGGVAALVSVPIGLISTIGQLVALVAVLVAVLALERGASRKLVLEG
jgi:low temperature requirement protein LtrA